MEVVAGTFVNSLNVLQFLELNFLYLLHHRGMDLGNEKEISEIDVHSCGLGPLLLVEQRYRAPLRHERAASGDW